MTTKEKAAIFNGRPMSPEEEKRVKLITAKIPHSPNFQKAFKSLTIFCLQDLRTEHPDWGLGKVLATFMNDFPPELPPKFILELTRTIIEEWEKTTENQLAYA